MREVPKAIDNRNPTVIDEGIERLISVPVSIRYGK